jgi:serum/glucocorticoid-regulated kinase 2
MSTSLNTNSIAAKRQSGIINNRDSLQRKQQWWLPYVVLEFDKNEVLVDALGGTLDSPAWMYSATL